MLAITLLALFTCATSPPSDSKTCVTSRTPEMMPLARSTNVASFALPSIDRLMVSWPISFLRPEGEPEATIFPASIIARYLTQPVCLFEGTGL